MQLCFPGDVLHVWGHMHGCADEAVTGQSTALKYILDILMLSSFYLWWVQAHLLPESMSDVMV